jgi:hypothetical protein
MSTFFKSTMRPRFDHARPPIRIGFHTDMARCAEILAESRRAYWLFEHLMSPIDAKFRRIDALNADIRAICEVADIPLPIVSGDSREILRLISSKKTPELACRAYAHYRIDARVARTLAPVVRHVIGIDLEISKGTVAAISSATRALDALASEWTSEERERCIDEIPRALEDALKKIQE